jgi:hypothetical protein
VQNKNAPAVAPPKKYQAKKLKIKSGTKPLFL